MGFKSVMVTAVWHRGYLSATIWSWAHHHLITKGCYTAKRTIPSKNNPMNNSSGPFWFIQSCQMHSFIASLTLKYLKWFGGVFQFTIVVPTIGVFSMIVKSLQNTFVSAQGVGSRHRFWSKGCSALKECTLWNWWGKKRGKTFDLFVISQPPCR